MTLFLQTLRHIFSLSGFYFIAYCFWCGWSTCLKLDLINSQTLGKLQIELYDTIE